MLTCAEHRQDLQVVRKELSSYGESPSSMLRSFQRELRVLKLLRYTASTRIVRILGSYVHKGKYNLLFPLAEMDLEDVFSGKRPTLFSRLDQVIEELRGLSTALNAVHECKSRDPGVSLVGCHHDLKPRNILIFDGSLTLADFGLSRLVPPEEGSQSVFKDCVGDYFAPECVDQKLKSLKIGRPSDIWSFGCLIVEMLTFFEQGPSELARFRSIRATMVTPTRRAPWFHAQGKLKPEVDSWLEYLEENTHDGNSRALLCLAREMLHSDPARRPNAAAIGLRLTLLALKSLSSRILALWDKVLTRVSDFNIKLERRRFEEWSYLMGTLSVDSPTQAEAWYGAWSSYRADMLRIHDLALQATCSDILLDEDALDDLYLSIRGHTDRLWKALPQTSREARIRWHHHSIESLQLGRDTMNVSDPEVASLAAMKLRLVAVMEEIGGAESATAPRLDFEGVKVTATLGEHSLGLYTPPRTAPHDEQLRHPAAGAADGGSDPYRDPSQGLRVLIEWWRAEDWGFAHLEEMFVRMSSIAALPNLPGRPAELAVLSSLGYFYSQRDALFGIAYEPPNAPPGSMAANAVGGGAAIAPLDHYQQCWPPATLTEVMQCTKSVSQGLRPPLGHRFALALALCACLAEVHMVGWLHHNLCADNVAFFRHSSSSPSTPGPATIDIREPYMIGFDHSRPDEEGNVSLERSDGSRSGGASALARRAKRVYRHPEYESKEGPVGVRRKQPRFTRLFDYYSLGVVLLEIGLWHTAEYLVEFSQQQEGRAGLSSTDGEARRHTLLRQAETLGAYMGEMYRDAVKWCLGTTLANTNAHSTEEFIRNVVRPLSACNV